LQALALLGSPRKGGNTDTLADAFLAGAAEAGAEIDKLYLDDYNIRPVGELGDDFLKRVDLRADDDWRRVIYKVLAADILVWAAPVYWQGVPAQMKCFVDRWSCYYAAKWLNQGMADKVWAGLVCYGHPSQDESHWIIEPLKAWVHRWRGEYVGAVSVAVAKKGAVAEMTQYMSAARELGKKAVAAAAK
jgi:multimeric flavodoxin WrbA